MMKIIAKGVVSESKIVNVPGVGRVFIAGSGHIIPEQIYLDTYKVGDSIYWVAYMV